jgi:hypothetical protein
VQGLFVRDDAKTGKPGGNKPGGEKSGGDKPAAERKP